MKRGPIFCGVVLSAVLPLPRVVTAGALSVWTPAGVQEGGFSQDLAVVPGSPPTLYAAVPLIGVFKSTDGGASWSLKREGLVHGSGRRFSTETLAVDLASPSTVYVSGSSVAERGVFKTTNGGDSWLAVNNGLEIRCPWSRTSSWLQRTRCTSGASPVSLGLRMEASAGLR